MPDFLHRISIDAPREAVHALAATPDGIARWWTGRPLEGDSTVGSRFAVFFGDADTPAAVMEVQSDMADEIVWRGNGGPHPRVDTFSTVGLAPPTNAPDNTAVHTRAAAGGGG